MGGGIDPEELSALLSAQELLAQLTAAAADCYPRDRDLFVAACPLTPFNLTGSYFRAPDPTDPDAETAWLEGEPAQTIEGIVVGEPHKTSVTTIYQVEFYGRQGACGYQQLVDIDRMLEQRWLFFDDKGWLDSWRPDGEAPANAREAIRQEHRKPPKTGEEAPA